MEDEKPCEDLVDIVFDGPPGPEAGRFVEVESPAGTSIKFGEWIQRTDGYWVLRFPKVVPLGYVLVELDRINHLTGRIKGLAEAGSADAKSLAADAALLLEASRG